MSDNDWKPEFENAWVDHVQVGFGQDMFLLYVRNATCPVGLAWGVLFTAQDESTGFNILGCYVPDWARRQGIMTYLLHQIRETFQARLITEIGSREGGQALLENLGFVVSKEVGVWYYPTKAKKR